MQVTLPVNGRATLTVYDLAGRRIATMLDGTMAAGTHDIEFDPGEEVGGVFFYRLRTEQGYTTGSLVRMR